MQLAQLNIAEAQYDTDDPRMDGFTGRIDAINALADRSVGFVWRLVDDSDTDGALDLRLPGASDRTLVNMSVWENIESLFQFTYKTAHAKMISSREEWFPSLTARHMVLWWIEDGHVPTLDEAAEKLGLIRDTGPSPDAFDFNLPFDEKGRPISPKFPKKDCA